MDDYTEDLVTFILGFMQAAGSDDDAIRKVLRRQLRAYAEAVREEERERCAGAIRALDNPPNLI